MGDLILRVRDGQITLKARGPSAASVADLAKCDAKKYEIDYFDTPEYSVSSDIKFKKEEFETRLDALHQETMRFLEKQGHLNPSQGSKTEFYFTTYLGQ